MQPHISRDLGEGIDAATFSRHAVWVEGYVRTCPFPAVWLTCLVNSPRVLPFNVYVGASTSNDRYEQQWLLEWVRYLGCANRA